MRRNFTRIGNTLPLILPLLLIAGSMTVLTAYELLSPPPPWVASSRYASKVNPVEVNPASIAAGEKIYKAQCIACHGKLGHGDGIRAAELNPRPLNLANPEMWLQTDGELFYKISKGRRPMPSFKKIITYQQVWKVINYVRTLAPKPTVLGYRFDVGQASKTAIGKIVDDSISVSKALGDGDSDAFASASDDLAKAVGALSAVTITSQNKYIVRLWKSTVFGLTSASQGLQTASGEDAQSAALSKFSKALAVALSSFGGVETGLLYQFGVPAPDGSGQLRTWFQREATPKSPFHGKDSSKPSVVSVFGPQTRTDQ